MGDHRPNGTIENTQTAAHVRTWDCTRLRYYLQPVLKLFPTSTQRAFKEALFTGHVFLSCRDKDFTDVRFPFGLRRVLVEEISELLGTSSKSTFSF